MKTAARRVLLVSLPLFAVLVVMLVGRCNPKQQDNLLWLNHHDTVKYVGIAVCASCHPDKADSFMHTGMGKSFGLATPEKSAANFNNHKPVYDAWLDLYYYPYWENRQLKLLEYRLQGKDTIHKRLETIDYIIGSGHHTNSHLIDKGGYLYQAPITFYVQEGRWDLPPGYENGNNIRFSRKIDMECMGCHNAMPAVEPGSVNHFTKIPGGIDCERCHGPGSLHVALKRAGEVVDTRTMADRSIVNPAKLPWELQVDVCQRCHLQGNNVLKPGRTFSDFKPGMKLSDVFDVYMPRVEGGDYFVMAGHAERLQQSACFIKSNHTASPDGLKLTCITCHNPHVSVRRTNTLKFNTACISCHGSGGNASDKLCKASLQERKNAEDNCSGCHMPASDTRDIPHVTVHDHRIAKPAVKTNGQGTAKVSGLYAVTNPSPTPSEWAQAYITWYEKFEQGAIYAEKAKELAMKEDIPLRIHFYYTQRRFQEIISEAGKLKFAEAVDGWMAYRIGVAYDETGKQTEALGWMGEAVRRVPASADFRAEYARVLLKSRQLSEAEREANHILRSIPDHDRAMFTLAGVYMARADLREARSLLLKLLQLNPDHTGALENLATLADKQGDAERAAMYRARLAKVKEK